jgi:hypothetical protein
MATTSSGRDAVEELAEEFLDGLRRGEQPTPSEYAERHPEHAGEILELFPALARIEQLRPLTAEVADLPARVRLDTDRTL